MLSAPGRRMSSRLPRFAADYLAKYLAYETRVEGYGMLLVDRYPPFAFDVPEYPIRIEVRPGELNRLAVFFRLLLVIPAGIVQAVIYSGWTVCCFFIWVVVLVLGRMPQAAFQATASVLRYKVRIEAYMYLLTPAYPKRLLGDQPGRDYEPSWGMASATRPLVLAGGGQGLLVLFIVLGVLGQIADGFNGGHH